MPQSDFKSSLAVMALAAAFAIAPHQPGRAADQAETSASGSAEARPERNPAETLSATEYFTMAPFVIPLIDDGEHQRQFVLVVAIELAEDEGRDELRRLSPKMRNEIYDLLFKMVSFRTIEPRIPRRENLQRSLAKVARRVAGENIVKSLVVHSSHVTAVR